MTKKDYILIASVFNKAIKEADTLADIDDDTRQVKQNVFAVIKSLAGGLARKMLADNPRFNADKFYKTCGFH